MTARRVALFQVRERRDEAPEYQRVVDFLNVSALAAIAALGWQPRLHAAADASVQAALDVARAAELIVILGGEDVHPRFYGGDHDYPQSGIHCEAADEAQVAVVHDAARRGTPLLAICRGHQLLNVAFGGDLIQHLPNTAFHRNVNSATERFTPHGVTLVDDGFRRVIDAKVAVQSSHHQAVGRLGSGLRAVATSDDGIVEAIAHDRAPILGVQWHPEHRAAPVEGFTRLLRHLDAAY